MKYSSRVGGLRPKYSGVAEPYKMLLAFCISAHVAYIFSTAFNPILRYHLQLTMIDRNMFSKLKVVVDFLRILRFFLKSMNLK